MKGKVLRWKRGVLMLGLVLALATTVSAQEARRVDVLEIEGPVTPIMLSYIERGIRLAEDDQAVGVVLVEDLGRGTYAVARAAARVPVDGDPQPSAHQVTGSRCTPNTTASR